MSRSAVVVGAGVFGASLARELAGSGWDVTLVDQYPPGHVRAASGGESRLIRFAHGADAWYPRWARRARTLWRELERESGSQLLVECGVAWFGHTEDGWEAASERVLHELGIPAERLSPDEVAPLFPSFAGDDLLFCLYEPDAGVLRARDAVQAMVRAARERGVHLRAATGRPAGSAVDVDGRLLEADAVVWACGAWLAGLFPDLVRLRITKQDVYFYGAAAGWQTPPVPAWVDFDGAIYGLGDLDGRGFKAAPDGEGEEFDPDRSPRVASPEGERVAREYLARRFPALAGAPLIGTRVCQYALTPDTNFLIAPHPEHENVWILGGGSGHGFKHGPALAEYVAALLDGRDTPDARFSLEPREPALGLRTAGSVARR